MTISAGQPRNEHKKSKERKTCTRVQKAHIPTSLFLAVAQHHFSAPNGVHKKGKEMHAVEKALSEESAVRVSNKPCRNC